MNGALRRRWRCGAALRSQTLSPVPPCGGVHMHEPNSDASMVGGDASMTKPSSGDRVQAPKYDRPASLVA